MDKVKIRIIQYVNTEYGDEPGYYLYKDIELPFLPHEKAGFRWSELGPHVWWPQSVHYDVDLEMYFMTINARWIQVWVDDHMVYDHVESLKELEDFIAHLETLGWSKKQKTYATWWD